MAKTKKKRGKNGCPADRSMAGWAEFIYCENKKAKVQGKKKHLNVLAIEKGMGVECTRRISFQPAFVAVLRWRWR